MNAIYCRVSTDEQAAKGYSLGDQQAACRNYLLSLGLTDCQEYIDDGYSGEFIERPALDRLRADLRAGLIQNIAIYDPDRLARNLIHQLLLSDEIEKAKAVLHFATHAYDASPEGRLFFSIRGAISAFEKEKIRERTSRGRKAKALQGKIVHNARPFGYSWDEVNSTYTINEAEAQVVRDIYAMCIDECRGSRTIAQELKYKNIRGRENKPLSPATVYRILSKEMYCGTHYLFRQSTKKTGQHSREIRNRPRELWIPVEIPAIVSRERWESAQMQLKQNQRYAKRNSHREYLLRGLLCCTLCGRSMVATGRPAKRKNAADKYYYYYTCISKESGGYALADNQCQCRRIPVDALDDMVWKTFRSLASDEAVPSDFIAADTASFEHTQRIDALAARQEELRHKQDDIIKWYRDNLINSATAEKELQAVSRELTTTTSALSNLVAAQEKMKKPVMLSLAELLEATSLEQKRSILMHSSLKIHAVRLAEQVEFCFKY